MKRFMCTCVLYGLLVAANLNLFAQQGIQASSLPIVTQFQMPIGDRDRIYLGLTVGVVNQTICSGNSTKVFPASTAEALDGWYVYTDFNTETICTGGTYSGDDNHTGEDWNATNNAAADRGKPIHAIAPGKVIAEGYQVRATSGLGYGNYVLLLHRLPDNSNGIDDEYFISMVSHMENRTTFAVGDLVDYDDVLGTIGETGAPGAVHLHLEIKSHQMLQISSGQITLHPSYSATYWPGTHLTGSAETTFINTHYYEPFDFIKANSLVGVFQNPQLTVAYQHLFYEAFQTNGGINVFGTPHDRGQGFYAHQRAVSGSGGSITEIGQDFRDSNGKLWHLALNSVKTKAYVLHGKIMAWWYPNATEVGHPMGNELLYKYMGGNAGSYLDQLTYQKFSVLNGASKTVIYNNSTALLGHYPVGVASLGGNPGDRWYIDDDGNGQPSPSADRFMGQIEPEGSVIQVLVDEGSYTLVQEFATGGSNSVQHPVWEGNNQSLDLNDGPPPVNPVAATNLTAINVTSSSVTTNWTDPNSPLATPYQVNRDDGVVFSGITTQSYIDNTVQAGQTHIYTVSVNNGPESVNLTVNVPDNSSNPPAGGPGSLSVFSIPGEAEIYLNGLRWPDASTVTPINDVTLPSGSYSLKASKAGFGDYTQTVIIVNNQNTQVTAQLQPANFPLTVEAENLTHFGPEMEGGVKMTPYDQEWYIWDFIGFPETGWIRIDVLARALQQADGEWPTIIEQFSSEPGVKIISTEWQTYSLYRQLPSNVVNYVEVAIHLDGATRAEQQHAIIVDKLTFFYVQGPPSSGGNPTTGPTIDSPAAGSQYALGDILPIGWSYSDGYTGTSEVNIFDGSQLEFLASVSGTSLNWNIRSTFPTTDQAYIRIWPTNDISKAINSGIFSIGDVNQPPVAQNIQTSTIYPNPAMVDLTPYVSDAQGNNTINWSTLQIVSATGNGTSLVNGSAINFTPAYRTSGIKTLDYKVADDKGEYSNTATLTMDVTESVYAHSIVFSTNSIELGYSTDVLSGDVVVNAASSVPTLQSGYELATGSYVSTPADYDVKANRINLGYSSDVYGNIHYNELTQGNYVTLNGAIVTSLAMPVSPAMPVLRIATPGTQDIAVANYATLTLAPGNYQDIVVGYSATLTLTGGEYHFRNLTTDSYSKVYFDTISEVRVKDRLNIGYKGVVSPAASSGIVAHDIIFYVEGINGNTGGLTEYPKAVETGSYASLDVNIYAPNGTVEIDYSADVVGAIIAKDVETSSYASLTLDSYFSTDDPLSKSSLSRIESIETVPIAFTLHQNYPNPFNPETQIRFDLAEAGNVQIDIFNVLGQKIITLINRQLPAGQHSVLWNGLDDSSKPASSGIYIYKLQAGHFTALKKMMFLK